MVLLIKYWREFAIAILAFLVVLMLALVEKKNVLIKHAENERDQYKSGLDFQNATLLNDAKKYEEKLKQLPKEITKIKTRYVAVYDRIDNYKEDENETKCVNALNFLNDFNY